MKLDALEHPKTYDLAARLGVSRPTALGHLELLWAFTGKHAPQGDIGKWADGAIARACDWMGDPEVFLQSLLQSRFIDADPTHRYLIHDWPDHAPRWVKAKLKQLNQSFITPAGPTVVATVVPTAVGDSDEPDDAGEPDPPSSRTAVPTTGATTGGATKEVKSSEVKSSEALELRAREEIERSLKAAADLAKPLREAGVKVTSVHPVLCTWVADGFSQEKCLKAVAIARETLGPNEPINARYLDKILRDPRNWQRARASPRANGHEAEPPLTKFDRIRAMQQQRALEEAEESDDE